MTTPFRPFSLWTKGNGGYTCGCGAFSTAPGLDKWTWRWVTNRNQEGRGQRGRQTEVRCPTCQGSKPKVEMPR